MIIVDFINFYHNHHYHYSIGQFSNPTMASAARQGGGGRGPQAQTARRRAPLSGRTPVEGGAFEGDVA